ncbi:hypothetical protein A8B78_09835 [Jannaschia sp. EhC01]|nr:hypothetical protein A8B78_09835 [Jannaschia sp. EhC01]
MSTYRPFERKDLVWTALSMAFALFYGFMGVLVLWFVLFDFGWMILLLGLPFLLVQLVVILGADRFAKWRRRNDPPPPPTSWARHHALSLGASVGALAAFVFLSAGIVFGAGR